MDCRKSLVLALGLAGAVGCVPQNQVQTGSVVQVPPGAVVEKAKDPPKHPPAPETCVAYGDWLVGEASSKPQASAIQGQLYDQARRAYEQALEINASCGAAYMALGQLYTRMGDHDGAVKWYNKGLEKLPKDPQLWLQLGRSHVVHKDWHAAVVAHRKAVECEPSNKFFQKMLGFCLVRAGQTEEALVVFRKCVGEAEAHYHLARILYETHYDAEARQHLQITLREAPTFEPAHLLLAQLDGQEPIDSAVKPAGFEEPPNGAAPQH
jgi:tetratricopeptide (TPR) repeat protein